MSVLGLGKYFGSPFTDTDLVQQQHALQEMAKSYPQIMNSPTHNSLQNNAMAMSIGTASAAPPPYVNNPRYKRTTIMLEESSNGTIIKIGDVVRICAEDDDIMTQIAAAYAEHRLTKS